MILSLQKTQIYHAIFHNNLDTQVD